MLRIGLTGGIGSGKSVVGRLFESFGAPVYDSDARAKALMSSDEQLRHQITELFGKESYSAGELNRQHIAAKAFADDSLLGRLNAVVHPAVARDFVAWCDEKRSEGVAYVLLESAILIESGFDRVVDRVICVVAPEELRAQRAAERDGVPVESVLKRMACQMQDNERIERSDYVIVNDGATLLVPRVVKLDKMFKTE